MDSFASKTAFALAAGAAATLGALFPRPSYEAVDYGRPWASAAQAQAWQPVSGREDRYSYSGALPADRGPIDVYAAHPWALARERENLARQEARLNAAMAEPDPQYLVVREEPVEYADARQESHSAAHDAHRADDSAGAGPVALAIGD